MRILTFLVIVALGIAKLTGHLAWDWLAVVLVPALAFWAIDGTAHTAFHAVAIGDKGLRLIQAWRAFSWDFVLGTLLAKFVVGTVWTTALLLAGFFSALLVSVGHCATAHLQAEGRLTKQVRFWFGISNLLSGLGGWCFAKYAFGLEWWGNLIAAASAALILPTLVSGLLGFAKWRMDRAERFRQLRGVGFANRASGMNSPRESVETSQSGSRTQADEDAYWRDAILKSPAVQQYLHQQEIENGVAQSEIERERREDEAFAYFTQPRKERRA